MFKRGGVMIDAVVNTTADFFAKSVKDQTGVSESVQATNTNTNTKSTKATEVAVQAQAVNAKDMIQQEALRKNTKTDKDYRKSNKEEQNEFQERIAKEAEEAAKQLSEMTHSFGISFSQEKDLKKTVVTVFDNKTDEKIRQIPSEDFIKIAKRIKEICAENGNQIEAKDLNGLLFDQNA